VDEVLEQVGLTAAADRRVREYSLGMRQRLGLAAAGRLATLNRILTAFAGVFGQPKVFARFHEHGGSGLPASASG
jgi:hypothetical protein